MSFVKEEMALDHYTWETTTESSYAGNPSRRLFNRYNGDQVLFLINVLAEQAAPFSLKDMKQMEEWILHQLPLEAKSEVSVLTWMKEMHHSALSEKTSTQES